MANEIEAGSASSPERSIFDISWREVRRALSNALKAGGGGMQAAE